LLKELLNTTKYITQSILKQCFEFGKHNVVDKVVCGNGFSQAFLMCPFAPGKHNIIICPNKAAIESKHRAYKAGEIDTQNTISFHYKESSDTFGDGGDIMMFVIDSFLKQINNISVMVSAGLIDKILIDEAHKVEQSSSYRPKLRDFKTIIAPFIKNCSIVSVTATPNHYTNIDIRINNTLLKPVTINQTSNRVNSINRAKADIKAGKNVYIATNDWVVIYGFRHPRKRTLEANFIVGESMQRSLVDKVIITHNPISNLVIGSSKSFEGMDLKGKDWCVYYFEDRSKNYQTFYISNLYQAISRPREGTLYVEYCRSECNMERAKGISVKTVDSFIAKKKDSTEKKMRSEHKKFHPYVIFTQVDNGFYSIKKDEVAINLLKEARLFDAGFTDFQDFLDVRKLTIKKLNEAPVRIAFPKIKERTKEENLLANKVFIEARDLFGDNYRVSSKRRKKDDDYVKAVKQYFRNKNYDGNYVFNFRETKGLEMLKDSIQIDKLSKKAVTNYNKKHKNDYNGKGKKDREKRKFADTIHAKTRRLIVLFVNNRIWENYNVVGNRQYSNIVFCPSYLIQSVCDIMGITFTQIDIRTANSRIIYALNGLTLPNDFYGENKKNKKRINISLNNFFYNEKKDIFMKDQKSEAKRKFEKLGFHSKVIDWLMDNFFECKYRGDLSTFLAWHEKIIIEKVKNAIFMDMNDGCIRKHDELMIFNNKQDLIFLNDFEYLGIGGWFKFDLLEEEETKESLDKFFKEMAEFEAAIVKKTG